MKIGVLSDTHGLLREGVREALQGCDVILHGGDINKQSILDELAEIAPLYVVRGNNDKDWAEHIPYERTVQFGDIHIFMTHKKKDLPTDLSPYDLVVIGHSHKFDEKRIGDTLLLNPGSCGPRRFDQEISFAIVRVEDGELTVEKIVLPNEKKK